MPTEASSAGPVAAAVVVAAAGHIAVEPAFVADRDSDAEVVDALAEVDIAAAVAVPVQRAEAAHQFDASEQSRRPVPLDSATRALVLLDRQQRDSERKRRPWDPGVEVHPSFPATVVDHSHTDAGYLRDGVKLEQTGDAMDVAVADMAVLDEVERMAIAEAVDDLVGYQAIPAM